MKKYNKLRKHKKLIIACILFIILFLTSIGYSSLNVTLDISGNAMFRVEDVIRITNATLSSSTSGGYENYDVKYSKNELITSLVLPNTDSTLTYVLNITNYSTKIMKVDDIQTTLNSNENIKYEIDGCNKEDIIPAEESISCTVKFYTDTSSSTDPSSSIIQFSFAELISSDATLSDLSVTDYDIEPSFVSDVEDYSVTTEATSININAIANDKNATVQGAGTVDIPWGESSIPITVIAEDTTEKIYTIKVNNIKPTPPTITGGNTAWSNDDQEIKIQTQGEALSGVDYYEYYITSKDEEPTETTEKTGTTEDSVTVTDNGTSYIYYRTVSKNGNKSDWSNKQVVNIDKNAPEANIEATASYSGDQATVTFDVETIDNESGMNNYIIYYKPSSESTYLTTTNNTISGSSGVTYDYYIEATDNIGLVTTTTSKTITLKTYSQDGDKCDYTYGEYESNTTTDLSDCTEVEETTTGTTYTTCTLDSDWTTITTSTENSCSSSTTYTSKVSCTRSSTVRSTTYASSCTGSTVVVCTSGYYAAYCKSGGYKYGTSCSTLSTECGSGGYAACYSGYYKKVTYKYKVTTYAKYYTQVVYNRTKTANTCWHD